MDNILLCIDILTPPIAQIERYLAVKSLKKRVIREVFRYFVEEL